LFSFNEQIFKNSVEQFRSKETQAAESGRPGNEPESATDTAWAMAATRETVISFL
jgi:hypothetical protein